MRQEISPNFNERYEREDWWLFRSLGTLCQKAGVPLERLRRLVAKEIIDNSLDATDAAGVHAIIGVWITDDGALVVQDRGAGIDGTPEEIAALFSIGRPLASSKLLRLPTRGALGNGLRVVAGAVLASGGRLEVWTRNRHLLLTPQDDGTTAVTAKHADVPRGTRVLVALGPSIPGDWGREESGGALMARGQATYQGRTSPHWYDGDSFFELLQAAGRRPVRAVVEELDGCSGAKAGVVARAFPGRPSNAVNRAEAAEILQAAREHTKPVRPERLGAVGKIDGLPEAYAKTVGTFTVEAGRGGLGAEIPFVVEVWAQRLPSGRDDELTLFVNRSPAIAPLSTQRQSDKTKIGIFGCGLAHAAKVAREPIRIVLGVIAPYIPITSDGKEPDLSPLVPQIVDAIERVARKAKAERRTGDRPLSLKEASYQVMEEAYLAASDGGTLPARPRQVMYAARGRVHELAGTIWKDDDTFIQGHLPDFMKDHPGFTASWDIIWDPRGHATEPHTGRSIGLGTLETREYVESWTSTIDERPRIVLPTRCETSGPANRFEFCLYVEKEGFDPLFQAAGLRQRYDLMVFSSKGNSNTSARSLEEDLSALEGCTILILHDFDRSGFTIGRTLREDTRRYRFTTPPTVIDLGLRLIDAEALGLTSEQVRYGKLKHPQEELARCGATDEEIRFLVDHREGSEWVGRRIELNAMSSRQLIDFLERKFRELGVSKVIPDQETQQAAYRRAVFLDRIRRAIEDVTQAMEGETIDVPADLDDQVRAALEGNPEQPWDDAITEVFTRTDSAERGRQYCELAELAPDLAALVTNGSMGLDEALTASTVETSEGYTW